MLPAIVAHHWPCIVQSFRHIINRLREILRLAVLYNPRHAPGLIERNPCNDRRVVVILFDNLHPFLCRIFHRYPVQFVKGRKFTPYQQPFYIGPVIKTFVFRFLVFADSVISIRKNLVDILFQRFFIRGRNPCIFPISLI